MANTLTRTIAACLGDHARRKPQDRFSTFMRGGVSEEITFAQLFSRACAYAQAYRRAGVAAGDLVIVVLQHTPHLFYSYLGAILAGAVPSFMPFPSPKQRPDLYWKDHEKLFERIQPRLIVTYEENVQSARAALPDFSIPVLIADDSIMAEANGEHVHGSGAQPDSIACLQHSSGTTGLKKGVMLTHRAIIREVEAYADSIGLTNSDTIASWLPLYHDMGFIGCFMTSVILGTHLVALDPFEWVMRPTQLLDAIQEHRATFCWLPNFAFSHLVNGARRSMTWDLSSIKAFINCSEPCKASTFDRFFERFADCGLRKESLQVCYAMAENVFAVTQTSLNQVPRVLEADINAFGEGKIVAADDIARSLRILSCGAPVPGVEIEVRDRSGGTVHDGIVGEVCIRSPFMFDGYYKLPEKTAERVRDGWYHSGDMGFVDAGELFITGRMDDMLIINGRNYYAHEIESIVNGVEGAIPGRNVAIGIEDARTDSTVVVVLAECRPDANDPSVALEIRRIVLEELGLAIHSAVILNAGEMVKTTSGKISRSKNKELFLNGTLTSRRSE